jgi:hypothetical protein
MRVPKMMLYGISALHLVLQFFYFFQFNGRLSEFTSMAKMDAISLGNANFSMAQETYIYLFLAILTLAVYVTVSIHLAHLDMETFARK